MSDPGRTPTDSRNPGTPGKPGRPARAPGRRWVPPLAAAGTGLYLATFWAVNNQTMLRGSGVALLVTLMVVPLTGLVLGVQFALRRAGKYRWAGPAAAGIIGSFFVFVLRPTLLDLDWIDGLFRALPPAGVGPGNALFVLLGGGLFMVLFGSRLRALVALTGMMTVAALLMALGSEASGPTGDGEAGADSGLGQVTLKEKPNVYFLLADAFASLAYMREQAIDVSGFTGFLESSGFRLYDDTYSNYQPTTSAMPAFLDMRHHYYRLTGHGVNFSEVGRASRRIIGGDNNLTHVLRRNGYSTHYVHNGSYLLLQGCSADSCFPETDALAGSRILLSHLLRTDLLSDEDKTWQTTSLQSMRERLTAVLEDTENAPRFVYAHAFKPGHPSGVATGKCDEREEIGKYARRVRAAGALLRGWIGDILARDPEAVIVLAGDHGPFLSNRCTSNAYIDSPADYRDRAGALMAVRWPRSYAGEHDGRISSAVNLFRFVLAALSDEPSTLLEGVAADDVFVRGRGKIYKVIEDGRPLDRPALASKR